jgi:hypothetical protein
MLPLIFSFALAAETRDTYDGHGRLLTHQVIDGATLTEDTSYTYDRDGNLTQKVVVTNGADGARVEETTAQTWDDGNRVELVVTRVEAGGTKVKRETWAYDKKGHETEHVVYADGEIVRTEQTTWVDGHKTAQTVTESGLTTRTTWTWDVDGRLHATEVKDGDGNVTSAYTAHYERPFVPIELSLGGGVAYQTDVDLLSVNGSFSISRKPTIRRYGADPLEIGASVSYAYGRSRGAVVNNALNAHFGIDLNLVAPRTTPFLFVDVDRNPSFNQNIDLEVAPVGVKFDLVPREVMKLDLSFAPILNFRSILIASGGTIPTPTGYEVVATDTNFDTLKLRGSFRFRLGYEGKGWEIGDTVEYLPTLWANDGLGLGFGERLTQDSIARNTFSFSFAFTDWLKLTESFGVVWDPTLALQSGCDGATDSLLCDGVVLQNNTQLVFTWQVKR